MENCLFCKIINGEIPSSIVYQDDTVIAFKDINPQAPVHILVVPRKHIQCATEAEASDGKMLSAVFSAIAKIAKENKLDNGFRIINNCGADGVMVIGATNEPQIIDKAALRSGRLEYHYYIPLPSQEVRKGIFEIHLSDKDKAQDVDLNKLAEMTEGFTSSDIKLIVEKAGRTAFQAHKDEITMAILEEVIKGSKSSVSPAERARYEEMKNSFEGNTTASTRRKIGF